MTAILTVTKQNIPEMSAILMSLSRHSKETNMVFYWAAIPGKASAGSRRLAYVPLLFSIDTNYFRLWTI